VPLSSGEQNIVVQHRQAISGSPLVVAQLDVPRLPVPSTETFVTLRYPEHWLPLWQSFATRSELWQPRPGSLLALLLLALWLERAMVFLAMRPRRRILAALLLAFAALKVPVVLWIVVLTSSLVTLLWAAGQRSALSPKRIVGAVAVTAIVPSSAFCTS
jgi:hypothetical protein